MGKWIQLPLTGSSFHLTAFFLSFDSIFNFRFNIVPKCCTHCCSPAGVALPSLLPVEDTPPPLSLHHASSMLLVSGSGSGNIGVFLEKFGQVWHFGTRGTDTEKKQTVSYRKYTRTPFYTVKGIRTTDVRSVQSFLYTAIAVIPVLRVCLSEQETSENALI